MTNRILAVDDNQVNLKVVSATLAQANYEVFTATSGPEALGRLSEVKPDLILLDINMPDMDGYEVCRRLRANPITAHIPVIMLTAHDTLEEKMKGFEAGADDYLTKPFQPAELQARIKVLIRRSQVTRSDTVIVQPRTIGVFSLRGGTGVTSVATNIAAALAGIWQKPTVLVDLALHMGQSALMLNLPLKHTWADLGKTPLDELDAELLQNLLLTHPCGVHVLAAPRTPAEGDLIDGPKVQKVLALLREMYSYIIIDYPHNFSETTLEGMDATDEILALLSPDLASVRAAVGALEVWEQIGISRDRIRFVMNWTFERKGLARKDIENVLKQPINLVIPFAPDTFVTGINIGSPPVLADPTSPIGALFEDYAYMLSRPEDKSKNPTEPGDAWKRVSARFQARKQAKD